MLARIFVIGFRCLTVSPYRPVVQRQGQTCNWILRFNSKHHYGDSTRLSHPASNSASRPRKTMILSPTCVLSQSLFYTCIWSYVGVELQLHALFGTTWWHEVSFILLTSYVREHIPWNPVNRRLADTKKLWGLWKIETFLTPAESRRLCRSYINTGSVMMC